MENPLEYTVLIGLPAYGRDYKTKEALASDWLDGKDFRNVTPGVPGTYFSIRDAGRASDVLLSNRDETITISANALPKVEKVYALYTPPNGTESAPSRAYSYKGELSEEELIELEPTLLNSSCNLVQFSSQEEYETHLKQIDEEYWARR